MSDFSAYTGWAIPEGNVVEVADASGRMLWSSAPPFDGIIYLRPSADISVDSTLTLVPADATAAYMLINEEVSDGAATEIKISSSFSDSGTAVFSLAGKMPNRISRVKNIQLYVSGGKEDTNKHCDCYGYLTLGAMRANYDFRSYLLDYETTEVPLATVYDPNSGTNSITPMEVFLSEINSYIDENGTIPGFELTIEMAVEPPESGDVPKNGMKFGISQAYVVIECE